MPVPTSAPVQRILTGTLLPAVAPGRSRESPGTVVVGMFRSTRTLPPATAAVGERFDARSSALCPSSPSVTVPLPQPETGTENVVAPVETGAPTAQPVAVPVRVKSAAVSAVTGSENPRLQLSVGPWLGVDGGVRTAVAGVRSIVRTADDIATAGPGLDELSVTDPAARVSWSVPSPQPVIWTT